MRKQVFIYAFLFGVTFFSFISCEVEEDNNNNNNNNNTQLQTGSVTDIDGNVYSTVVLGTQEWMTQNLRVTKYNDGVQIPLVEASTGWDNAGAAFCWYDNNESAYKNILGGLYNWYAVETMKLCPTGWSVPTYAEYVVLEEYLIANGYNYDNTTTGNKIAKAMAGISYWYASTDEGVPGNTDYSDKRNKSFLNAHPGGFRGATGGIFSSIERLGAWWLASYNPNNGNGWFFEINFNSTNVPLGTTAKSQGYSIIPNR